MVTSFFPILFCRVFFDKLEHFAVDISHIQAGRQRKLGPWGRSVCDSSRRPVSPGIETPGSFAATNTLEESVMRRSKIILTGISTASAAITAALLMLIASTAFAGTKTSSAKPAASSSSSSSASRSAAPAARPGAAATPATRPGTAAPAVRPGTPATRPGTVAPAAGRPGAPGTVGAAGRPAVASAPGVGGRPGGAGNAVRQPGFAARPQG